MPEPAEKPSLHQLFKMYLCTFYDRTPADIHFTHLLWGSSQAACSACVLYTVGMSSSFADVHQMTVATPPIMLVKIATVHLVATPPTLSGVIGRLL